MRHSESILTGGGTAGYVSLNQAIIPTLLERGYEVHYIGSEKELKKELIAEPFQMWHSAIASSKLRRYSMQNLQIFSCIAGIWQAFSIIQKSEARYF